MHLALGMLTLRYLRGRHWEKVGGWTQDWNSGGNWLESVTRQGAGSEWAVEQVGGGEMKAV